MGYLQIGNLLFAGLLAGAEVAIHYGTALPQQLLTDTAQLQVRQSMTRRLRVLMPLLFLPALLTTVILTAMHRAGREFEVRGAALCLLLVWIATRVAATVPINSATMEWDPAAPPQNWKVLVVRAERFHVAGVWSAVIAFLLLLTVAKLSCD